jgi:hypothetical protein
MIRDAYPKGNGTYRYWLTRIWDPSKALVMFVCLNPSKANETNDDNTVTRCVGFAEGDGFGGLVLCNLFALRGTDPSCLLDRPDPIGPENNQHIRDWAAKASKVIVGWGNIGKLKSRADEVLKMLPQVHCLRITEKDFPEHPLRLPKTLRAQEFKSRP